MQLQNDYIQKVYAGLLGKSIGVRHGSNIEGWSYERIKSAYGEITDYLFDFKNFCADDDTNGSSFFIRALEDYECSEKLSYEDFANTLMNYVPDGHGFLWWGPYGVSTENTAFRNLKSGVKAPRSGSIAQNGKMMAEQVGGQIFIDPWGMVAPGNVKLAASLAEKAAAVTHDGEGVHGGKFIAACVSSAFKAKDINEIIEDGLSVIPVDCTYAVMVRDLMDFYREKPDSWLDCLYYVRKHYWLDKYPGGCHVIPNSAIIMIGFLYGQGDFDRSINICNMCGWDTDCNVGNLGAILGVFVGLDGIGMKWRKPINDLLICSSILGAENIQNIAQLAYYVASYGYKLNNLAVPEDIRFMTDRSVLRFNFELPGATHAFRVKAPEKARGKCLLHTTDCARTGKGSIKATAYNLASAEEMCVYYQTYYRPDDFNDSRYDPSFSPVFYPGQTISGWVRLPEDIGFTVLGCTYVHDGNSNTCVESEKVQLIPGQWMQLKFTVPHMSGACIDEAGFKFMAVNGYSQNIVTVYVDDVEFSGNPDYTLDFSKEKIEFWNLLHMDASQFVYNTGIWNYNEGCMSGGGYNTSEAYTGSLAWENYRFEASIIPQLGEYHNINFRVQGSIRSYALGLTKNKTLALYKKTPEGYKILAEETFNWTNKNEYVIFVDVKDNRILAGYAGKTLLNYEDNEAPYLRGGIGASTFECSRCNYRYFRISESQQ